MKRKQIVTVVSVGFSKRLFIALRFPLLPLLIICLAGCTSKFFDPTQIGRYRPVPAVNVILDSLGVAEERPSPWEGAEEPRPIDVMALETDYTFRAGDVVRISIFELLQEDVPFVNDYTVTETGKISIPEVGVVQAAGLTESQLEEEIRQILSPSVLKEPSVVATLLGSQQHTYTILGDGIPSPSRYTIPRYDFRLTDALATAGGISRFNISYIYISRPVTGKEAIAESIEPEVTEPEIKEPWITEPDITEPGVLEPEVIEPSEPKRRMLEIIAPWVKRLESQNKLVMASTEMITDKEVAEVVSPEVFKSVAGGKQRTTNRPNTQEFHQRWTEFTNQEPIDEHETGRIEWTFQDGKWIPVQVGRPEQVEPEVKVKPEEPVSPLKERIPPDFDWDQIGMGGIQTRVIKIPTDRLLGGDPRYNVVIRPGDTIHVPVDIIGECCIIGNVNSQGYINITGRPMTLKMAIAAAGGLGPLAWPKRCEVIRRIGEKKEEIVMVDLDKIARGEQPDFFIKPNDLINVGTHPTSMWRSRLLNAFGASYGFGFAYTRNFADRDYYTRRPIPHWF